MVIYLILKVLLMKNNIKFYIFFVERTNVVLNDL